MGYGDNECTARQLATFGQMYLDGGFWADSQVLPSARFGLLFERDGNWKGNQLISMDWIEMATQPSPANESYGYLWWHAEVDGHPVHFAWGHGGNFVMLAPDLQMVVVTTAHNFVGDFTNNSWDTEGALLFLIAERVLPTAY